MDSDLDEETVLAAVTQAIAYVCDLEPESLRPDSQIGDLGIDSMDAADIIIQSQTRLGKEIDFQAIPPDWSQLTVSSLAMELARSARPART